MNLKHVKSGLVDQLKIKCKIFLKTFGISDDTYEGVRKVLFLLYLM